MGVHIVNIASHLCFYVLCFVKITQIVNINSILEWAGLFRDIMLRAALCTAFMLFMI